METVGIPSSNEHFESNHAAWLLNKLNTDRLTTKVSCDVKIVAGTEQFSAHKCILTAFSEFWRKMFTVKMKENYSSEALINGVNGDIMNILLTYIYTGKVSLNDGNVYLLIEASHYMQLPFVLDHCSTYLEKKISKENCFDALNCAIRFDLVSITATSQSVILKNLSDTKVLEKFKHLDLKNVTDILGFSNNTVKVSEETKFKAIIKWVNHDKESRKDHFYQIFTLLDLQKFSKTVLQNFVATEELVAQSMECTKLVMNAAFNLPTALTSPVLKSVPVKLAQPYAVLEPSSPFSKPVLQPVQQHVTVLKLAQLSCSSPFKPVEPNRETQPSTSSNGQRSRNKNKTPKKSTLQNLLIIGGCDSDRHVVQYTISTKRWKAQKRPSECGWGSTACRINNYVYLMGGEVNGESKSLDVVERLDLNNFSDGWTEVCSLMVGRRRTASSYLNDALYVVGGLAHDSGWLSSGEFYLSERNDWYKIPDMSTKRQDHAMSCFQKQLYVIGGYTPSTRLSSMERFDARTNSWRNACSMSCARDELASVELNGEIYAIGGTNGDNALDTVEIYRPRANKWVSGSPLCQARQQHCACVVDGKIYVVGGCSYVDSDNCGNNTAENTMEVFDPAVGRWQVVTRLSKPRFSSAVVAF